MKWTIVSVPTVHGVERDRAPAMFTHAARADAEAAVAWNDESIKRSAYWPGYVAQYGPEVVVRHEVLPEHGRPNLPAGWRWDAVPRAALRAVASHAEREGGAVHGAVVAARRKTMEIGGVPWDPPVFASAPEGGEEPAGWTVLATVVSHGNPIIELAHPFTFASEADARAFERGWRPATSPLAPGEESKTSVVPTMRPPTFRAGRVPGRAEPDGWLWMHPWLVREKVGLLVAFTRVRVEAEGGIHVAEALEREADRKVVL